MCGRGSIVQPRGSLLAVAAGNLAGMLEYRYPMVLGKDFAGTMEAVEEA